MKSVAFVAVSMLAFAAPVLAWATPPTAARAVRQPAPETSATSQKTMTATPTERRPTPKGVSPAVWRQYNYDRAPEKLNGPNNGKPLTKLQVQQAQLDKATAPANGHLGVNGVVAEGSAIRQVGAQVVSRRPVIIKVAPQKVTFADGKSVKAYRLSDGNLYYKEPGTGTPTKLGSSTDSKHAKILRYRQSPPSAH
jgi:hypothetical protein